MGTNFCIRMYFPRGDDSEINFLIYCNRHLKYTKMTNCFCVRSVEGQLNKSGKGFQRDLTCNEINKLSGCGGVTKNVITK